MSVSEPLGATVRTLFDATPTDTLHLVESDASDCALRRSRQAIRTPHRAVESSPVLPASAIHELRTPLTAIHGYAQVLQRAVKDNPRATNGLSVIVRESGRLTQMLTELSDLTDLCDGDESDARRETVDVRELVEAVAEGVRARDTDAHEILVTGDAHLTCYGKRLAQAVTHVLSNATRYSAPQSLVTVRLEATDECVRIIVMDEGIGICGDDAERVYRPFERGVNAREFGTRGLGLGLFIARLALADDGGTVTHASRPSAGTVFTIEMPRV